MLRALIFDFDGTILDTETPEFETWSETYQTHGVQLDVLEWAKGIGTWDAFDPVAHLEKLTQKNFDRAKLEQDVRVAVTDRIKDSQVIPGVEQAIAWAQAQNLRLAVASSSSHEWVTGHLGRLGLLERFERFSTRYDVEKVKPDPALYLDALEKLQLEASACLAIEDSPNGCKAALAAGLRVVAVPNTVTRSLGFPAGTIRCSNLKELDFTRF